MGRLPFMMALLACIGVSTIASPCRAVAAETADCMDTAETNYEFGTCTNSKVKEADSQLNIAWKRLFQSEDGTRTEKGRALLDEQRAWLAFREKACSEYFLPDAGREEQVIHGPLCVAGIIDARTADLNGRYQFLNP